MKTALIRMAFAGALALGGLTFAGVGTASAACVQWGGGIVCGKPVMKKRYYKRHHGPRVVLRFGEPRYHYADPYRPRYYVKRRHWGHGHAAPRWHGNGWMLQGHGRY